MKRKLFEYNSASNNNYNGAFFLDMVSGWYYHPDDVVCVLVAGEGHKLTKIDFAKMLCSMDYSVIVANGVQNGRR